MKITTAFALLALTLACTSTTYADTFGSGLNAFGIDFVTIGNPGNAADTTGKPNPAGEVDYIYRMGTYEISEDMIDAAGLGITHDTRGDNKPATSVSWYEAATFVNWLNVDAGGTPAYKFSGSTFDVWVAGDTADYDAANIYRSKRAKYFLPSVDEWYKSAYHDASAGIVGTYFNYPTGSDSVPDGIDFEGDTTFDAVFNDGDFNSVPNDITDVGLLSPYGTAGQGGNVFEWDETDLDLTNGPSPGSSARGVRGGSWGSHSDYLLSSDRILGVPTDGVYYVGFRVASVVPEPSTLLLGLLAAVGLLMRRTRRRS